MILPEKDLNILLKRNENYVLGKEYNNAQLKLENKVISHSCFKNKIFTKSEMFNVKFSQCIFNLSSLNQMKLKNVVFDECIFVDCNINDTLLEKCEFYKCTFNHCTTDNLSSISNLIKNSYMIIVHGNKMNLINTAIGNTNILKCEMPYTIIDNLTLNYCQLSENSLNNISASSIYLFQSKVIKCSLQDGKIKNSHIKNSYIVDCLTNTKLIK